MKRLLKILGGIFLLLIAALVLIPILFEDKLVQIIKDNVNASLNAEVDFGDIDLTLLRSFPDFSFQIEDITVDGVQEFDSLRLASIGQVSFTLDVMSVVKGDKVKIKEIHVDRAYMNAVVREDGKANYDIIKESETEAGDTTDVRDEYVILLEEYDLTNSEVIYDNRSLGAFIHLQGLDHRGEGSLTDKRYDLNTVTKAKTVDVRYEDIKYLKQAEAEIVANFDIQDDFREINFKENEIRVNELLLKADGQLLLPEDGMGMDLTYASTNNDLKSLLSLVPDEYMPDLEGMETAGVIDLSGEVKGHYDDSSFPGFSLHASIADGRVQYPDLPEDVDDINVEILLAFPGGGTDFNTTTLDIPSLRVNIAESPISGSLSLRNMVEDPFIRSVIKGQVDLSRVKEAITMEGIADLEGVITADVDLEGELSAIEQERYSDFKASGQVILQDFLVDGDSIPVPMRITTAHMNFSPAAIDVPTFNAMLGTSDLKARGQISNYLGYALKDELLSGRFEVESQTFDMNQFLTEEEGAAVTGEATSNPGETSMAEGDMAGVIPVPGDVDLSLNTKIGKLIYENMELEDIRGQVKVKDKVASLNGVKMKVLGGTVGMSGSYDTKDLARPLFDFGFDIAGMDIPSTAGTFNTVQTLAPIAKRCQGDFSSEFKMSTALDGNMEPIFSSLTGGGELTTSEVILENFKPLMKIAEALKLDNWKRQRVNDVDLDFEFVDGKVIVKPFDITLDGISTNIGGSMGFDQQLDYDIKMKIPVKKLGGQANQLLSGLVGQANALGLNLSVGEFVNMNFKVTGLMNDPKVTPQLLGQEGTSTKEIVKDIIDQKVDEVKEEVKTEVKEEAREQAEKIMAEAQKQADALRAEAGRAAEKVKTEGYSAAKKLEDEAKNPIAKIAAKAAADKLRKETDEQAQKIRDEADSKAQSLIDNAQQKADALLE